MTRMTPEIALVGALGMLAQHRVALHGAYAMIGEQMTMNKLLAEALTEAARRLDAIEACHAGCRHRVDLTGYFTGALE